MSEAMLSRPKVLLRIVRLTWLADPGRAAVSIGLSLLDAITPALIAIGLRDLVTAAADGDTQGLTLGGALIAAGVLGGQLLGFAAFAVGMSLRERAGHRMELDVLSAVASRPGLEHLEDPDYLDRVGLLLDGVRGLAGFQDAALLALGAGVRIVAALGLLATVDVRLMLLGLFGVPIVVVQPLVDRITDRRDLARMPLQRRAGILDWFVRSPGPARELRLLGAQTEVSGRIAADRAAADQIVNRSNARIAALESAATSLFGIGTALSIVFVADLAARDRVDLGALALLLVVAAQLSTQFGALSELLSNLLEVLRTADHHRRILMTPSHIHGCTGESYPPGHVDVALVDVGFTYPGANAPALQDLTLSIPAGATIALVGDNGAGKSTLIDLLCGLRKPSSGSITIGGHELHRPDSPAWPQSVSGAFQDPVHLDLTVAEVVGLGDIDGANPGQIERALEQAGAHFVWDLTDGIQTPLGRSFDGGIELSGGQWQRLALARALVRPAPRLLVLDEPTANLDPHAEDEILTQTLARTATGSARATTVLVTHRMSAARLADLIVVLHDGRITERGTHAELMRTDGWYAKAFEAQAAGYR